MLKQIRYFQSIVKHHSFSIAADECYISQSAISQQIKALEEELGFLLFRRYKRTFELTQAGEYFYQQTLILVSDFDTICAKASKLASFEGALLKIGFLKSYHSPEFYKSLEEFSLSFPKVELKLQSGTHEELFDLLRNFGVDIVLSDQRRAFSLAYENLILKTEPLHIEISSRYAISKLSAVTYSDLKRIPCILVSSKEQERSELEFYQSVIGIKSEIIFATNLEEALLAVVSGKGFMIVDGESLFQISGANVTQIPLFLEGKAHMRNYCLFWRKGNNNPFIKEFSKVLFKNFAKNS